MTNLVKAIQVGHRTPARKYYILAILFTWFSSEFEKKRIHILKKILTSI